MESFVRRFIRSSLVWLGIGVLLGLGMVIAPMRALVFRPAHAHANLLGFVSMMIFGVAYHVLPRFSGNPLYSRRLAGTHLVVANAGLGLLVAGWLARGSLGTGTPLVVAGALASAVGAGLFIFNVWRTLDGAVAPARPELVGLRSARGARP